MAVKTTKRKYSIIKHNGKYRVRKRFWKFSYFMRTKFKVIEFDHFTDVASFVINLNRKEQKN